jgi:hypothetical protein
VASGSKLLDRDRAICLLQFNEVPFASPNGLWSDEDPMPRNTDNGARDPGEIQAEWLGRLSSLIASVSQWATDLGWSTRRISKQMEDSQFGRYEAPALLMQKEVWRILLDPVASSTPGSEGVVDLYLLPAYDDIASIFFENGSWRVLFPFDRAFTSKAIASQLLTADSLTEILSAMTSHVA